jgi:pilus assembly protein Flp/PilA
MLRPFNRLWRDRRGVTAVEYGLIIALIILAIFASLSTTADNIVGTWNYIENSVVI